MSSETNHQHVFLQKAVVLAQEFAKDAVERDKAGGTAKIQRDQIRESGLLKLIIPVQYGGDGQPWSLALRIIRELAKADASLAHVLGYHFYMLVQAHYKGSSEQKAYYYTKTAQHNWFWGNSSNPLERSIIGKRTADGATVSGKKGFSSGSPDSDILLISWNDDVSGEFLVGAIPTARKGIAVQDDWDSFGQRQTGSGTVVFEQVNVENHEILDIDSRKHTAFSTLDPILSQSILANIFVGSAEGAIAEAKNYTLAHSRPWVDSGVDKAAQDPFILRQYGEFWIELQAAVLLVEHAANKLDQVWAKEFELTEAERGESAVLVATANAFAAKAALAISSAILEVTGARSTASQYGFDRFWRNVRTHTLHNPTVYKLRNIGNWVLNDEIPEPGVYS